MARNNGKRTYRMVPAPKCPSISKGPYSVDVWPAESVTSWADRLSLEASDRILALKWGSVSTTWPPPSELPHTRLVLEMGRMLTATRRKPWKSTKLHRIALHCIAFALVCIPYVR